VIYLFASFVMLSLSLFLFLSLSGLFPPFLHSTLQFSVSYGGASTICRRATEKYSAQASIPTSSLVPRPRLRLRRPASQRDVNVLARKNSSEEGRAPPRIILRERSIRIQVESPYLRAVRQDGFRTPIVSEDSRLWEISW